MIYVIATLLVKPEMRAELIEGAKACIAETLKETACIAYDLHESVTDPTKVVFVEKWENAEALGPHGQTEHLKAFVRVARTCVTGPMKVEIITPASVDVH